MKGVKPTFNPQDPLNTQHPLPVNQDSKLAPLSLFKILEQRKNPHLSYAEFLQILIQFGHIPSEITQNGFEEPEEDLEAKDYQLLGFIDTNSFGKRRKIPKNCNQENKDRIKNHLPLGAGVTTNPHELAKLTRLITDDTIEVRFYKNEEREKSESMIFGEISHLAAYSVSPFAFQLGRELGWQDNDSSAHIAEYQSLVGLQQKYGTEIGRIASYLQDTKDVINQDFRILFNQFRADLQLFPYQELIQEFENNRFADISSEDGRKKDLAYKDLITRTLIIFSSLLFKQLYQEVLELETQYPLDDKLKSELLAEKILVYQNLIRTKLREIILNILTSAIFFNQTNIQNLSQILIEEPIITYTEPTKSPGGFENPTNPQINLTKAKDLDAKEKLILESQDEYQPVPLYYDQTADTITSCDEFYYYLNLRCRPDVQLLFENSNGVALSILDFKLNIEWYKHNQEQTEIYAFVYLLTAAAKVLKHNSKAINSTSEFTQIFHFNLDDPDILDVINNQVSFTLIDLQTGERYQPLDYLTSEKFAQLMALLRKYQGALTHFYDYFKGDSRLNKKFFEEFEAYQSGCNQPGQKDFKRQPLYLQESYLEG